VPDTRVTRIGIMFISVILSSPVILSEAKALVIACPGHEILRFAQDDSGIQGGDSGTQDDGGAVTETAPERTKMGSGNYGKCGTEFALSVALPALTAFIAGGAPLQWRVFSYSFGPEGVIAPLEWRAASNENAAL